MPRVLAKAGFDVALLTPRGSLAEKSRYVSHLGVLATETTPMAWLLSLVRMIDSVSPFMLVPCDEMAIRLLFSIALDPPPALSPELRTRLTRLIEQSLGDPGLYEVSIDKTLLPAAAEAIGVPVPRYAIATDTASALEHAARLGYPVVLKRRFGFAGEGVAIVNVPGDLAADARRLLRAHQLDLGEVRQPRLLVQKFISGPYHSQALVAIRGKPLASFAWERFVATQSVKGQTSVLKFIDSPQTKTFSEALCRNLAMSGFFNVQFVLDENSGEAHLLEINRRIVTHMHLGERAGSDLGVALHDTLDGRARTSKSPHNDAGDTVVIFPREWLRDPASHHLERYPVDVPWDEPELLAAMLAMRHED